MFCGFEIAIDLFYLKNREFNVGLETNFKYLSTRYGFSTFHSFLFGSNALDFFFIQWLFNVQSQKFAKSKLVKKWENIHKGNGNKTEVDYLNCFFNSFAEIYTQLCKLDHWIRIYLDYTRSLYDLSIISLSICMDKNDHLYGQRCPCTWTKHHVSVIMSALLMWTCEAKWNCITMSVWLGWFHRCHRSNRSDCDHLRPIRTTFVDFRRSFEHHFRSGYVRKCGSFTSLASPL